MKTCVRNVKEKRIRERKERKRRVTLIMGIGILESSANSVGSIEMCVGFIDKIVESMKKTLGSRRLKLATRGN